MLIDLSLNEIDCLLMLYAPRDKQQLGKFADAAKAKLQKARKELIKEYWESKETSPGERTKLF